MSDKNLIVFNPVGYGLVRATGSDHPDYLHRRTTQKWRGTTPPRVVCSCQLAGDGKTEAVFEALRTAPDESLLVSTPAMDSTALSALCGRFVFSESASFEPLDGRVVVLVGEEAASIAEVDPRQGEWVEQNFGAAKIFWWRSNFHPVGLTGLVIGGESDQTLETLLRKVESHGGRLGDEAEFQSLRILSGNPWHGVDFDRTSVALEAGLGWAISLDKGCFPGQEVLARITNLGHPARKVVAFRADAGVGSLVHGMTLVSGDAEVGAITSVTKTDGGWRGLALVKWPQRNAGTILGISGSEGAVEVLGPAGE